MGFETCDIFGCSYEDMGKDLLVHYEQIDSLMPKINKVFDRGGLLVVFSTAYNGHFVILTDFSPRKGADKRVRDVDLFIIDGKGKNGNGLIGRTSTRLYSPYRWREDGRLVETTGFMGIVGILPGDFGRFKG
jgi:hypothetical protein